MMKPLVVSVDIAAPRGEVFSLLSDLERSPVLKLQSKKAEILTSPPVGISTRWRETRMGVGREAVVEVQIVEFLPPKFMALIAESPNALYRMKLTLEAFEAGTRLRAEVAGEPKNLLSQLMAQMLLGAVKREIQSGMRALKAAAEGQSEPAVR
jgi:carbon monoxide dehydrogenase subunit G